MDSALHIPEILHCILEDSNLSAGDLIRSACISKFWSDVATHIIWARFSPGLTELFNLIPALRRLWLVCEISYTAPHMGTFGRGEEDRAVVLEGLQKDLHYMEVVGAGSNSQGQFALAIVRTLHFMNIKLILRFERTGLLGLAMSVHFTFTMKILPNSPAMPVSSSLLS